MLPSKAWNSLSPDLYATFWGLTLYDLYVPRNRYESEIAKQQAALKALEELSDNSSSAITKRKKEKERIQESLDRLTSELHKHEENVSSVRRRLSREKDKWLTSCPDTLKINMEFLQRCIFPRCTFSMPDAVYCAMFVNTLHSLGTPFFNTVNHIDVLICKTLQPMICCCTEYEAGRLGRFLFETLKIAYYWKVLTFSLSLFVIQIYFSFHYFEFFFMKLLKKRDFFTEVNHICAYTSACLFEFSTCI
jgi:THO complex subunit 2